MKKDHFQGLENTPIFQFLKPLEDMNNEDLKDLLDYEIVSNEEVIEPKKHWFTEIQKNDLLRTFTLFKYEKWSMRNTETGSITEYHIVVFFNKPYLVKTNHFIL